VTLGVVVFEKKRFEAIVDGNAYAYAYEMPWHKDRRRNSYVLKIEYLLVSDLLELKTRRYFNTMNYLICATLVDDTISPGAFCF
jgi:hypothetical protein